MTRREVPGTVYLIHLDQPYKHARHYTGWASDLEARLAEHEQGRGARLLAVVKAAGISWHVSRTWPGTRARERQLKTQGGASRRCPDCKDTTTAKENGDMGIFGRDTAQRDAEREAARLWQEREAEQEQAAWPPEEPAARPEPQALSSGIFHTGPGRLDISGQVIGPGHTVVTPEGVTTTPGTPSPVRQREARGGGGGHAWHNDGIVNRGDGQVTISGDTVMGCGQNVALSADREAG